MTNILSYALYHGVMSERIIGARVLVLLLLSLVAVALWLPVAAVSAGDVGYLTVRFLNVGQGDAIHILTPDGYELLVDGGPSAAVLRELAKERSFFDRKIDVVVATHPDTDHVAGLVDVLQRYEVGMVLETTAEKAAPAAEAFGSAVGAEGSHRSIARAGQVIQLGASTTVRILSPRGDASNWRSNAASIVLQVQYGETEFILTGDAPSGIEKYLVGDYGDGLESEVLKLGHHGSDTSTSQEFLEAVQPQFAVVSAGVDNRYGHPHKEVVVRASKAGAQIMSTAEEGTITFESDGKQVWLK